MGPLVLVAKEVQPCKTKIEVIGALSVYIYIYKYIYIYINVVVYLVRKRRLQKRPEIFWLREL